jgi:transposase
MRWTRKDDAMSGQSRRRWPAEEKLRILEEARQSKTTVAGVLRRHGLDATTFYPWERLAKAGMGEALAERPRKPTGVEREVERLRAELDQKRRIIAEVVEENLELKKGLRDWRVQARFTAVGRRRCWRWWARPRHVRDGRCRGSCGGWGSPTS